MWRWIKRTLLVVLVLVIGVVGYGVWQFNKPRKCKVEDAGPLGVRVEQGGMLANYYPVRGGAKHPAILVIGGSEGGLNGEAKREALSFQAAGFNALQIAYHCAPGQENVLAGVPLETFFRGLNWLKGRSEVDPTKIGIVGYSKGAEAALNVAARRPDVRVVVAGMPSSVTWGGFSILSYFTHWGSTWSENGEYVQSMPYGSSNHTRGTVYALHANGLKLIGDHPDAVIPVERVAGPILMVCGDQDLIWPSCEMGEQVQARLRAKGRPTTAMLRYPAAGHGLFGAPWTAGSTEWKGWEKLGGTLQANQAARKDAWPKVITFLHAALDPAAIPEAPSVEPAGGNISPTR